jgi:hypothetical protein
MKRILMVLVLTLLLVVVAVAGTAIAQGPLEKRMYWYNERIRDAKK